ncbi:YdcH family protein [Roseobacter ponti]|uniref:YdcH family protein n=1 Tax=Roseobacter ponti TaxID=1891787 RepID=A0A858SUE2_9RHOB|nr:YdcH family protein [Roseobacter ponti]QJF51442.1 YdcH family protein [Roseobacter ponti]
MSHVPHELAADFPDKAGLISSLRQSDSHFARLADAYHEINREVHRAETDVAPVSDEHLTEMRKQRMHLKDQIAARLAKG